MKEGGPLAGDGLFLHAAARRHETAVRQIANIEVTNANGFYRSASVPKAGDSCNYHANWKFTTENGADIFGNDGAGVYTVTVSGNNQPLLQFSVTLAD